MKAYGGDLDAGKSLLATTIRSAKRTGLSECLAKAQHALGLIYLRESKFQQALECFDEAENLLLEQPPEDRTMAVTGRARVHFAMGDVRFATHILEGHLLRLNQQPGPDPCALLQTYSALIGPYFEAGLLKEAQSAADEAKRLGADVGEEEHLACMHINRAGVLIATRQRADALKALDRAEELFNRLEWKTEAAKSAIARGTLLLEKGELELARESLERALEVLEGTPDSLDKARVLNQLGRLERLSGNVEQAKDRLGQGAQLLSASNPTERALGMRELALCHMASGQEEEAMNLLRSSIDLYRSSLNKDEVAATFMILGDLLRENNDILASAEAYRQGLESLQLTD